MNAYVVCPQCEKINRVPLSQAEENQPNCGNCKNALPFHQGVQELTHSSMNALLKKSPLPVVIDFWAPWCGPCRSFAPTFQQVAKKMSSEFVFAKVNTESHPHAGAQFQVRSIPTLIVFNNGSETNRISGALPPAEFERYLNSLR